MSYQKRTGLCITKFCRHTPRKGHKLCSKCSMRDWRACYPMKARLAMLRDRARRKKVPFDLTLDWLGDFLERQGYDNTLHHLDRVIPWAGYVKGNLQVLSIAENTAKGNRERRGQAHMF